MENPRECQIAYFSPTFGTVAENDNQFDLVRAIYMPDKLNLYLGAGEKKKVSPCHFPTVVPELIQSLLWKVASFLFHWG